MIGIMYNITMPRALLKIMHLAGPYSMISYKNNWPKPKIEYDNHVLIKTAMGGICATDLHMISLYMSYFASIFASPQVPFPMGHECIGTVMETGSGVRDIKKGDRVVLNPFPSCDVYGFKKCISCEEGNEESCLTLVGEGDGSPLEKKYGGRGNFGGISGGGFCEYFTCLEKQLFIVPEIIPDEVAVLIEPFSVGLHAVVRNLPEDDDTVLVFGIGTIGLMVIAALRLMNSRCKIIAVARYQFQMEAALRLGADDAVLSRKADLAYADIASLTDGILFKPMLGKKGVYGGGGADKIFDCVATESSLDDALHLVRSNGTIIVIGQGYTVTKHVDWSIQVLKEIEVKGSIVYGSEKVQGEEKHTFALALDLMEKNSDLFKGIVTHTFSIEDYKRALRIASSKGKNQTIKAVFDYR